MLPVDRNVSGPVPKEKVTPVTVVDDVTPLSAKVNVAGPMVYGLWETRPGLPLAYVPPLVMDGRISSFGWLPPIASRVTVSPETV